MALEDAIKEHASALREVAAAIRALGHGSAIADHIENKAAGYEVMAGGLKDVETKQFAIDEIAKPDAEVKPDADLEQAVSKVEEKAKAESKPLDYAEDVLPLLKEVGKKSRDALVDMLSRYGVKAATKLLPEQYPDVVADAKKYLAG